ncbi:pectate lyase [Segetibacter sp. 3557_3]|uniref:pectate lyase family protein n=1 Tax=Segetibacter sp. 3557_3 TaxID=2547429 RepID=UPI00105857EB|nr:pectate lyase [Segetibacter sp. 3557_3]TDH28815.1 pectate lyase [Segetibacter sp. 3557_3]
MINSSALSLLKPFLFSRIKLFKSRGLVSVMVAINLLLISAGAVAQTLAFPGAEGFGKYASGGRGGQVAKVTNLDDSGPGSFRSALEQYPGEPLTVVFDVSGIIALKSALVLKRSDVTIAGQTAPGDGICLKDHSFIVSGAGKGGNKGNIIIRYLRSRPGGTLKTGLYGFDMENCHTVIIDHCSFSWANEECAAMYDIKNTTVQWSIISEGLYEAGHAKGHRSYGGVWGGQYASYHHNLIAHQNSRAVRFNGSRAHDTVALVDYRNNVIYNWGNPNAAYGGDIKIPNGVSQVNMVGNYYKPGPATPGVHKFIQALDAGKDSRGVGQWYLQGNIMEGNRQLTKNNWKGVDLDQVPAQLQSKARASRSFEISQGLPAESATTAYNRVLEKAGATMPRRDATDKRVVDEVRTTKASGMGVFGKPGIIDSPMAVGGWATYTSTAAPVDTDKDGMPDVWESKYGLDINNAADRNKLKNGYTMLEIYLNELAGE